MSPTIHKTLRLSLIDAFLFYLMVGVGETYLPAYVLSIGMNEIFAGLLASLPLMSGAFLQLFTPKGLQKVGSHKSWVVLSASTQALTFLPLVYFSIFKSPDFWTLFLILTFYWAANLSAGPAWNYWMGHVVPSNVAGKYFSKRGRVSQVGLLIGIIGGGLALQFKVQFGPFTSVFSLIFFAAFIARVASSFLLGAHHFNKEWVRGQPLIGVRQSVKVFFNTGIKRKFFMYLLPLTIAIHLSSPFVTPYLIAQVKQSYAEYMACMAMILVGKILMLMWIETRQESLDPFKIFAIGLVGICPSALMWSFNDSFTYIVTLQLFSGMAWACHEVGLALIVYRDLKQDEKVPILTVSNLLNSFGIIVGAGIGGKLISMMGTDKAAYHAVFIIGGIFRFVFAIVLIKILKNWHKKTYKETEKKAA